MSMEASTSRRRPSGEQGLALPVVMGTLLLMLIFLATASTRATIGLHTSAEDVASKRALQTAKAGLRVAIQRQNGLGLDLNQILNPSQQCLIDVGGVLGRQSGSSSNYCPAHTESLGTGASFTYRISPVVGGATAGGLLSLGSTAYLLRRTVVSSGTVDGVTRRVSADIVASASRNVLRVVFVNLISSGTLQLYKVDPGSFRECTSVRVTATTPNPPNTGC
jgi:hypothetical protein